jgi:circadian clock protein KaiC
VTGVRGKLKPKISTGSPSATKGKQRQLAKAATGIRGLDEITFGGVPRGRSTLVCGGAGCGKTLLAIEFLVRGATEFGEPGVMMTFEETAEELAQNVRSLGFDLDDLIARKLLVVDFVRVERSEIDETGDYDLEGLFVRLGHAIDTIGAQRVALDTLETLFAGLSNEGVLRAELRRLFRWLKDRKVTSFITGERGDGQLTRHGLEEYISDCVIVLDHRVANQVSTRRLRIVKYRGTTHGTNEYPFLIDETGFHVLPITSLGLSHEASVERVSTGVARLDVMLKDGYYRGATILVSGTAGSGKTSLAAHFAHATCARGEKCLYVAMEESPGQIIRNMRSIGLDLERWIKKGLLDVYSTRPTLYGLETHLSKVIRRIEQTEPRSVIFDPVSSLLHAGSVDDAGVMVMRLIDFLKVRQITVLLTDLTPGGHTLEATEIGISSLVDTWLLLRSIEVGGERNRQLFILKSRGTAHSNQLREFLLSDRGIDLRDVYIGPEGVLTGSARVSQEANEKAARLTHQHGLEAQRRDRARKRAALEARIAALRGEFEADEEDAQISTTHEQERERALDAERALMSRARHADTASNQRRLAKNKNTGGRQ